MDVRGVRTLCQRVQQREEMSLVPSLLQAIVKADGEALVMHAGDKPYVVSPGGQVELASRGLTLEAVNGILGQLLPAEIHGALDEFGAIQYELPAAPALPGELFTVVAARGGDDVWVEIRRRRVADDDRVPDELFAASSPSAADASNAAVNSVEMEASDAAVASASSHDTSAQVAAQEAASAPLAVRAQALASDDVDLNAAIDAIDEPVVKGQPPIGARKPALVADDDLVLPDAEQLWPARPRRTEAEPPAVAVANGRATD